MLLTKSFASPLRFLNLSKGVISLLHNPSNTDSVYDIEDGLYPSAAMQLAVEFINTNPSNAQLLQERYIAPAPDLEALLQYPQDSLGYCYASSLTEAGFDPAFYRAIAVQDDASYVLLRLRQTHDIWHLITGFGTNVAGELGLKAFELAQTRRPMALVLLTFGLLKALLKTPDALANLLPVISHGYQLGLHTQPLFAQKWEEQWEKPLHQWQQELSIVS